MSPRNEAPRHLWHMVARSQAKATQNAFVMLVADDLRKLHDTVTRFVCWAVYGHRPVKCDCLIAMLYFALLSLKTRAPPLSTICPYFLHENSSKPCINLTHYGCAAASHKACKVRSTHMLYPSGSVHKNTPLSNQRQVATLWLVDR